jgi:hypothetical protein
LGFPFDNLFLFIPPITSVPRLGRQQSRRQVKKHQDSQDLKPCDMAKSIVVKLDVVVKDRLPEDEEAMDGDDEMVRYHCHLQWCDS